MQPKKSLITIDDNANKIKEFINDLILQPRENILKWANITKQTTNLKIWYPWQHLASLITWIKWEKTWARWNDICDWTEVKSCSRVDQMDKCKICKNNIARQDLTCPVCGSDKIERKNDSKWLFTIRSEDELKLLTEITDRILLIITHYPKFDENNFSDIMIQSFEIWTKAERQKRFSEIMNNYYHKIYLEHLRQIPNRVPAPKNFWPFSFQFYLCNPINTLTAYIKNYDKDPEVEIYNYVMPDQNRLEIPSLDMPINLLTKDELEYLTTLDDLTEEQHKELKSVIQEWVIPEKFRDYLPLRDTDKISTAKNKYKRK